MLTVDSSQTFFVDSFRSRKIFWLSLKYFLEYVCGFYVIKLQNVVKTLFYKNVESEL